MPLHLNLGIGGSDGVVPLDGLKITRLDDTEHPADDAVFTYRVAKTVVGGRPQEIGRVEHRYGDGRVALCIEALAVMRRHHEKHGDPHAAGSER